MRMLLASCVVMMTFAMSTASAAPDVTITWQEGEMSRDMSIWTTTITVTGTKVHYESTYSGRDGGNPWTKPKAGDGTVKDPNALAAALAAFDKAPAPKKQRPRETSANQVSACVKRGTKSRCVSHIDKDPETAELKAIALVKDAALAGVTVPTGL